MDNVQCDVQVPLDHAVKLRDRMEKLRSLVDKEIISTEKRIKLNDTKAIDNRERLISERRALSHNNLVRLAVILGAEVMAGMKDDVLVKRIAEIGIFRGRPRLDKGTKANAA